MYLPPPKEIKDVYNYIKPYLVTLPRSTPEHRVTLFSPVNISIIAKKIAVQHKLDVIEIMPNVWAGMFWVWIHLYFVDRKTPYPSQAVWYMLNCFGRTVYREIYFKNTFRHQVVFASHREMWKSWLAKMLITYTLTYPTGNHFSGFVSTSNDNAKYAMNYIRKGFMNEDFGNDYGRNIITEESEKKVVSWDNTGFVTMSFKRYQRGIDHDQYRLQLLFLDDPENKTTVNYPRQMNTIWETYTSDMYGSMDQGGGIIFVLCNYLTPHGLTGRFLKGAHEKIIIPLWTADIKDKIELWQNPINQSKILSTLTWPERYSWLGGDGKYSIKEMIDNATSVSAFKGEESLRSEMLCDPTASFGLFYDQEKVKRYSQAKNPINVENIQKMTFNVYEPLEATNTKYLCGMDYGLGADADASSLIILKMKDGETPIVCVSSFINIIEEGEFIETINEFLLKHFTINHVRENFIWCPERSTAGGSTTVKFLNEEGREWYVFKEMVEQDLDLTQPRRKFIWGVQRTNKNKTEIQTLGKKTVESGKIIITCPNILNEISVFSRTDAVHNRRLSKSDQYLLDVSQHFDLISALENCAVGLRWYEEEIYATSEEERNERMLQQRREEMREGVGNLQQLQSTGV